MKPNLANIGQQIQNAAKQEIKNTFDTAFEQISGPVAAAQPADEENGANVEELKRQEQAKLSELRSRLDSEMNQARQLRQQSYQEYVQRVDEQMQMGKPSPEENQQPVEAPTSVPKGPAAVQAKKGTKEMGKMKG